MSITLPPISITLPDVSALGDASPASAAEEALRAIPAVLDPQRSRPALTGLRLLAPALFSSASLPAGADGGRTIAFPNSVATTSAATTTEGVGSIAAVAIPRRNLALKRAFDILAASILLAFAAPVILLFALAIWWEDRGSPFYTQIRVGRDGRPLRIWKLRSMYRDADQRLAAHLADDPAAAAEWRYCFKLTHDPRILPGIGHLIRRSSLDELPQLWNILRGDMSLVGPRPFPHYHLASFGEEFRDLRASVTPGLTGLWQITSRSDGSLSDQESWDTLYIRHQSFWLDLSILVLTFPMVAFGRGAR